MNRNKKNSSGESSNADNWFEKSNNNISQDDPPFFLRNSSSSDSPPDNQRHDSGPPPSGIGRALLQRSGVMRCDSQGSSSEDFRSVIDDLTVENKKLKKRLKRFEKLHDAHLQNEKLFEVRVHGLPPEKKRELEDTLKQFALSLGGSPVSGSPLPRLERFAPGLQSHKTTSSSHTSNQQIADSAYASMSASGQGSSVPGHTSTGASVRNRLSKGVAKSAKSRDDNIQSYLLDIPEGLLPRRPPVMTEKAKSKLVVRQLEQIFAGKGAAKEGHQQPLQQQEVSQMAARADRNEIEARGQRASAEGIREARIMPEETEDPMSFVRTKQPSRFGPKDVSPSYLQALQQDTTDESSPEQRPTRPLDLDPFRAQIPTENIDYIRHLGFSPPDIRTMSMPEEGHGWIYLNLLINMAQLHTLNVTADFVKKALTEYSSKFELSDDGRKVRWQGGTEVTKTSSDGSSPTDMDPDPYYRSKHDSRRGKRSKTKKADQATVQASSDGHQKSTNTGGSNNQVAYTPLFFHRENSDEDLESSFEDSGLEESPQPAYATGVSSGLASSGRRTSSSRKKRDDGPIIFYNKVRFCTDLSGDRGVTKERLQNIIDYQSLTPDGLSNDPNVKWNRESLESSRGPLSRAAQLPDPMDLNDNPIPAEQELAFPHDSPAKSSSSQSRRSSPEPMDFEVSGLGGVCPDDNFEITVKNRHMPKGEQNRNQQAAHGFGQKVHHHRLAAILGSGKRNSPPTIDDQIIGMKRKDLPPSALPAPSYFLTESSPETDESDADSDGSGDPNAEDRDAPATAPQPLTIPAASSDEDSSGESDEEDDDSYESDDSVDLLAAAREIDPARIQAQEREYDSAVAERLAEEIPAGSSAATAGGGSGFASPASDVSDTGANLGDGDEGGSGSDRGTAERKQVRGLDQNLRRYAGLKRSRTSDSMVVNGKTPKLE
ncbi:MAG: hypothetical protein Q9165_007527 [Trypethelium subeluteriae]